MAKVVEIDMYCSKYGHCHLGPAKLPLLLLEILAV